MELFQQFFYSPLLVPVFSVNKPTFSENLPFLIYSHHLTTVLTNCSVGFRGYHGLNVFWFRVLVGLITDELIDSSETKSFEPRVTNEGFSWVYDQVLDSDPWSVMSTKGSSLVTGPSLLTTRHWREKEG